AVVEPLEPAPRRDPRFPERLGTPNVPDPGHEPLVEEGVADLALLRDGAQPRDHRLEVGWLAEDVGAEAWRASRAEELEHGTVPEHGLVLAATQHEPRRSRANRRRAPDAPAAVHPQVAAQDEAALEAEQEVLPHGLDAFEPPSVEPPGESLDRRTRMRGLDLDALADQNLQLPGGAMERITFRHAGKPTIEPCRNRLSESAGGLESRSPSSRRRRQRSSWPSSPTARRTCSATTARSRRSPTPRRRRRRMSGRRPSTM